MAISTPQPAISNGIEPIEDTPSTNSIAGCFAAVIARLMPAISLRTPVAVSLCVPNTTLILWPVSLRNAASIAPKGAPCPQGVSIMCTSNPCRWHISIQRWLNMPNRGARTVSPADNVLLIAASQPPVPVDGSKITSPSVIFNTRRTPATAGLKILPNAGDRWSIVAISQALRMLSGMLVGPGMKTGF